MKKLNISSTAGATLMELVIAVAVMGVTMAVFASQMSAKSKEEAGLEKEMAFVDLVSQLQQFSNSHALCTGTVGGTMPATGDPLSITLGGLNLSAGASFQNGQLQIKELKWAKVLPISPTEAIGYFLVQADLDAVGVGGGGFVGSGGTLRNFPQIGSGSPGIYVDMTIDSVTGKVTSCGAPDTFSNTQRFSFPITVNNHDSWDFSGHVNFPLAYADTNYVLICSMENPSPGSGGINYGQVTPTALMNSGFDWHYWQERGNWIPSGTVLHANCIAHHD
jgi:type II secretory pathway pseudopilin PulG